MQVEACKTLPNEFNFEITISDEFGLANTFPITIYGNGKLIDNSATALINTDYGSITIVYNGIFWKVISFSN